MTDFFAAFFPGLLLVDFFAERFFAAFFPALFLVAFFPDRLFAPLFADFFFPALFFAAFFPDRFFAAFFTDFFFAALFLVAFFPDFFFAAFVEDRFLVDLFVVLAAGRATSFFRITLLRAIGLLSQLGRSFWAVTTSRRVSGCGEGPSSTGPNSTTGALCSLTWTSGSYHSRPAFSVIPDFEERRGLAPAGAPDAGPRSSKTLNARARSKRRGRSQ